MTDKTKIEAKLNLGLIEWMAKHNVSLLVCNQHEASARAIDSTINI